MLAPDAQEQTAYEIFLALFRAGEAQAVRFTLVISGLCLRFKALGLSSLLSIAKLVAKVAAVVIGYPQRRLPPNKC